MIVGIESAKQHPDDSCVWVLPNGRVIKRINKRHPERRQWLEFSQYLDKDGYAMVRIANKNWRVHRLVYLLFVGPLKDEQVICHVDGDKTNNHWENLMQSTQAVNISHKFAHGTMLCKERHPRSIHTSDQVNAIRQALLEAPRSPTGRLKRGFAKQIADQFGASIHLVHDLCRQRGDQLWQ